MAMVLFTLLAWILAEGIYSVVKWGKASTSIVFTAVTRLERILGTAGAKDPEAYADVLTDAGDFAPVLPLMQAAGVGLGNTPFKELMTEASATKHDKDGCRALKPTLRKTTFFLRTQVFDQFDPVTVFYDADAILAPELKGFLERYAASPPVSLTSNAAGERLTVPLVDRPRKVIVAGDSVAFGAMLDDRDTIASRLQRRDAARQYISTGVPGVSAPEVICNLEAAAKRYQGQIEELIYVYCENDLQLDRPFGRPEEVVDWLRAFAAEGGLSRVTVVYAPYVYNVAPHLTRLKGYRGGAMPTHLADRGRLKAAVEGAGFRWLDIGELALEDNDEFGTQFAFWHFFLDHVHLSPYGTARLVERLTSP